MNSLQKNVIVWVPRLTATLSFLGSSSIIYMILSDRELKLSKPNHRLMLMLSIFDFVASAAYAMTTLALPKETGAYGAIGNSTTCSIQGFFLILGLSVPLYNASLSVFYLLSIKYRMHQAKFSKMVEPFLHIVSVSVPLTIAMIAAVRGLMTPYLTICSLSSDTPMGKALFLTQGVLVAMSGLTCVYCMLSICHVVIAHSREMRKYSFGSRSRRNNATKETVKQAVLYSSAFFITFFFPAISLGRDRTFVLELGNKIFYPLQGFWNFMLYIRPDVGKRRNENPEMNIFAIIVEIVFHARRIIPLHKPYSLRREHDATCTDNEQTRENKSSSDVGHKSGLGNDTVVEQISSNNAKITEKKCPFYRVMKDRGSDDQCVKRAPQVTAHLSPLFESSCTNISAQLESSCSESSGGLQWDDSDASKEVNATSNTDNLGDSISDKKSSEEKKETIKKRRHSQIVGSTYTPFSSPRRHSHNDVSPGNISSHPPRPPRVSLLDLATANCQLDSDDDFDDTPEDILYIQ